MKTEMMTTRTRTKTRTTRTGRFLLCALVALAPALPAKDKKKPTPPAVIAGTVFRDAGFALPGAQVAAVPDPPAKKKQEWKAVADARGEFVLRVPGGPASYNVVVRAAGYRPQEKKVTVAADERLDFNFLLEPGGESK